MLGEDGGGLEALSEVTSDRCAQKNQARCEAGRGDVLLHPSTSFPAPPLRSANIYAAANYAKFAVRIALPELYPPRDRHSGMRVDRDYHRVADKSSHLRNEVRLLPNGDWVTDEYK
ncbi:hypothetical protein HIM_01353 [Hirsutella minnesotensis 3608]|nr:hypothetical protein HIM_01353 [Hirsutella minnesotensis 3608]